MASTAQPELGTAQPQLVIITNTKAATKTLECSVFVLREISMYKSLIVMGGSS
jgi:hypothetical protein